MDSATAAASIIGLAGAGVQIAIKLVTLARLISTAQDRVSSIDNDISTTSGVLQQLGKLMSQKLGDNGVSIFSQGGLETTRASAAICERVFMEVEGKAKRASEQLRSCKRLDGGRIKLSRAERARWPFLQPSIDVLRADLRDAIGTLLLMLQVTSLALSKRMADRNDAASIEQRDMIRTIIALQQNQQSSEKMKARRQSEQTPAIPSEISTLKRQEATTETVEQRYAGLSHQISTQPLLAKPRDHGAPESLISPTIKGKPRSQNMESGSHANGSEVLWQTKGDPMWPSLGLARASISVCNDEKSSSDATSPGNPSRHGNKGLDTQGSSRSGVRAAKSRWKSRTVRRMWEGQLQ